jgi:hypothetical protein
MKERGSKEFNPGKLLATGLLLLALTTGCSKAGVVNGVEIDRSSACDYSPITIQITSKTKGIILHGKEFPVNEGRVDGFSVNTQTGRLEADAGDVNEDGYPDTIEASVVNNQITARLVCGKPQTESNK